MDQAPNFLLHPPTHDADPPAWPAIDCRDGYAWGPAPLDGSRDRRPCLQGRTSARAELVAASLQGRPIEQLWALRRLLVGEPGDRCPGVLAVLFPIECPGCGRSHVLRGDERRRAALALQPGALEVLRRADPAMRKLLDLALPEARRNKIGHPRVREPGLPVGATPEESERLQVFWALDLAARKLHPLRRPRRRSKITRAAVGP